MLMLGLLGLTAACLTLIQANPPLDELFVVEGDKVIVRSGADGEFYAFHEAPPNSLVRVREIVFNWGRVPVEGPLFEDSWGWIRVRVDQPGKFQVGSNRIGRTFDTTAVYAPDLEDRSAKRAWRPICTLPADTQVEILDATTEQFDGRAYHCYKVPLTPQAEGWINMANLRPATAPEAARWLGVLPTTPTPEEEMAPAIPESAQPQAPARDVVSLPESGQPSYLARYLAAARPSVDVVEEIVIVEPQVNLAQKRYFDGLENIFSALPATDMSDDLAARLWEGYAIVVDENDPNDLESVQMAGIRMRQLELASCLREERRKLDKLNAIIQVAKEESQSIRQVLEAPTDYAFSGRLSVSSVFTGSDDRPIMYRIKDPINGRTIAYLSPSASLDLSAMIGQRIGVIGPVTYDNRWQVQVINPTRVDLVAAVP